MKEIQTVLAIIFLVVFVVAFVLGCSALGGWVFMLLFNFISPVFHGPVLDFPHAWASAFFIQIIGGFLSGYGRSGDTK